MSIRSWVTVLRGDGLHILRVACRRPSPGLYHSAIGQLVEARTAPPVWDCPESVTFKEAGPADAKRMSELGLGRRLALRRFARGDRCFVGWSEGEPVFMCWDHHGPCYIAEFGFVLSAEETDHYLYHVVTRSDHRGKGICRAALSWIGHEMFRSGAGIVRMLIGPQNATMIRAAHDLGYTAVSSIKFKSRFCIGRTWITNIATREAYELVFFRRPAGPRTLLR